MINEQALINIAAPKGITSSDIDVFCDKLLVLMTRLRDMGYIVHGEMDVVNIIESECLNVLQFDFPLGSFDAFKRHAMACDELLRCRTELDNDDFFADCDPLSGDENSVLEYYMGEVVNNG